MTGKDLLLILGEINPQYYEEGEYQTIGDETHPRPAVRTLLIAALIALILAVPGCAKFLFSPLNGDELSLGGTYRGNGIVTVLWWWTSPQPTMWRRWSRAVSCTISS